MSVDLQQFLKQLESAGELARVTVPVSPLLEVSEIAIRQSLMPCANRSKTAESFDPGHSDLGGKAVLIENVADCDFPLAINTFGSYRRMELALGLHDSGGFEALASRIASLTKLEPPKSLLGAVAKGRELLPLLRVAPRSVRRGVCQQVVRLVDRGEVNLLRLPAMRCWPLDGDPAAVGFEFSPEQAGTAPGEGRYITFGGVHTIHADDMGEPRPSSHNIGMYRAQLIDETRLAMHWHVHHDGAAHWRSWKKIGKPMPVAICLGGESVLPYAATAPLPPGISELLMAGFLNGRGIPLVPAKTVPLRVPANSEIVIEGYVSTECGPIGFDPRDRSGDPELLGPGAVLEGPFGDHTGFYSLPDRYPVMEVTAITHRKNAVFPSTIVGPPPMEDYYLGKATERVFRPPLELLIPDLLDYHLPQFGCFHNCAFVSIRKEYPLQARRVMSSVWGAGQMAWTKIIVVVDEDVNVHDEPAVWRALLEHCHFGRDLTFVDGPLDILDHAAPRLGAGTKVGFDATRKITGEEVGGISLDEKPRLLTVTADMADQFRSQLVGKAGIVGVHLPEIGGGRLAIVHIEKSVGGDGERAVAAVWDVSGEIAPDFVIIVDRPDASENFDRALFFLAANCDPRRDAHRSKGRIAFDATRKMKGDERGGEAVRDYPDYQVIDDETRSLVDRRWSEYGFE